MYETKLDKWADYLLDTGKGNNLINFKDTKSSTVEVLLPNINQIFSKTESSFAFEIYNVKQTEEEEALIDEANKGVTFGGG